MPDSFANILQIKIRETNQTNKEFAKEAGIKKNELDGFLKRGEIPNQFILGKLAVALNTDFHEIASWMFNSPKTIQPISKKFVKTDFKKPKSPLKAKGRVCIRCLFRDQIYVYDTVELAHYQGDRSALGKGRGVKCSDILKAPLCKPCHNYFDIETEYKSVEKSEEFLFYIALFIAQEFEAGDIIIKESKQ